MKKFVLMAVSFILVACDKVPSAQDLKDLAEIEINLADINFENPAEIDFISPAENSTNVKGLTPITLLWKEPVLALQNQQQAKAFLGKYITISPEQEGEWRTLGTSGIMFQPLEPWKPSTKYTLGATPEILADFSYSFETERLSLNSSDTDLLVSKEPIRLNFNQEVSLGSLEKAISLTSIAPTKIDITYGTKIDENEEKITDKSILVLTPQSSWPEATLYTLTIAAPGSYSIDGPLPLEEPINLEFTTAGPFELSQFQAPPFHQRSAVFTFSSLVSSKTFAENLVIKPEPKNSLVEEALKYWVENSYDSQNFYLSPPDGAWDPEVEYEISFKPGFTDTAGRNLKSNVPFKFQTNLETFFSPVYIPANYTVFARDAKLEPTFVYGGNTTQLTVSLNGQTKTYPIPGSLKKRKIWTLDLPNQFPQIFNTEGQIIPGNYKLNVVADFKEDNRFASFETRFFVSDFSVEIKSAPNDKVQVYAQPYPGETALAEALNMEFFVGDWQTERRYNQVNGVESGYETMIPQGQFKSVKVTSGDKVGYGTPQFNQGMSPWDTQAEFGDWQYSQTYSGALFTDRPLYKPNQKIYFKGLLRELQLFGKNFPLKPVSDSALDLNYEIVVFDPEYNEVDRFKGVSAAGSFNGEYMIQEAAKLGNYRLVFNIMNADGTSPFSMETPFWVEEYRKPNFLIESSFSDTTAILEETLTAKISAQYAFGGAITNKPLNYTVTLFGNERCRFWCWGPQTRKDKVITSGEALLDENGEFALEIELKDLDLTNIDWNLLTLNATVNVSDAEQSSTEISIPFETANREIVLKAIPNFLATQETAKLGGSVKNLTGDLIVSAPVKLRLLQTKWVRNERKNADGNFYGEWESIETEVKSVQTKTNEKGEFEFDFTAPTSGGEYIFQFETTDDKGRLALLDKYFWVAGNDLDQVRENNTNNILWLFPNQDTYKIGETVEVFSPNAEFEPTRVHATLERGEVFETLDFNVENSTVSFVVEDWMSPNVFVSILVEGIDEAGEMQVKWGAHPIKIEDTSHTLQLKVTPEKMMYRPGDEVVLNVETQVANQGQAAEVAIAVVDETLLALKARVPLDLMESLIGKWPLGVSTYHTLANFMSAKEMAAIMEEVRQIADRMEMGFGGGGGKGDDFKPRGDFRDTAEFVAKLETGADGKGTYSFKLPDNLTTWNIFAVGATKNNAFGTNTSDFQVSLPLLISEIVPNFFQAGDELELGLLVYRDDSEVKKEDILVSLNLPPEIEVVGDSEKTVSVGKEARVYFTVRVKPSLESKTINFGYTIESEASQLKDAIALEREILPPAMSLAAADFQRVENTYNVQTLVDPKSINSSLTVKIFASLSNSLETLIDVAEKINYGCTEQRLSLLVSKIYQNNLDKSLNREVPNLALDELVETRDQIEKSFIEGGGYAFWEDSNRANFWVTTQVLEYAPLLAENNMPLNQEHLSVSADFLRTELFKTCDDGLNWQCPDPISRTHAASVLVDYNRFGVNDLDFLKSYTNSLEGKIRWIRTAQKLGDLSPALETLKTQYLTAITQSYKREDRYGFWSETDGAFYSQDERLTALIFETLMNQNAFENEYEFIARYLSESQKESLSGNSSMHVLKTLAQYVQTQETASVGANFNLKNITANQTLLEGTLAHLEDVKTYSATKVEQSRQSYELTTDKPVLMDFVLTETLPASDVVANAKGFWIEREVNLLQGLEGQPLKDDSLQLGENYLVKLKIVTPRAHRQVLVEDPIPSGVEIVNFNFDNADQTLEGALGTENCDWGWCQPLISHQEYRLDRARFFIDYLPAGTHEITYILRPRLAGDFEWLPAKVEEMYFPEIAANTAGRKIEIKK